MTRRTALALWPSAVLAAAALLTTACDLPVSKPDGGVKQRPVARIAQKPAGPSVAQVSGGTRLDELDEAEVFQLTAQPAGQVAEAPRRQPVAVRHDNDPEVDHLADGEAALERGDAEDALEAFRMAAFDLGSYESFMGVARAARVVGQRELVFEALESAAGAEPDRAEPLVQAARLCLGTKELERGLVLVDRGIAREPTLAEAFNVRGRLEMARQQYDRALLAFDRAIDLDPAHVWAYNNMGYVQLLTGRYQDAVESLEIATTLRPVKAYMFNNLGLAYEKSGRLSDAWSAYNQAVSMQPAYVNAQLNLKRIRAVAMARAAGETGE